MRSKLLKPLLLTALAALLLSTPQSATQAQSRSASQTAAQAAAQSTDEKWGRYTYAGEEFSVEMPSMPFAFESSRYITMTKSEPLRSFGLYSHGIVLLVTSFENPQEEETLDSFAAYPWGGRGLSFARDVKLGNFAGKEYESAFFAGHTRARAFRTKRHVYLIWAMAKAENDPRIVRFLDSLTLDGKPSGVAIYEPPPPAVPVPLEASPNTPQGAGPSDPPLSTHAAGEPYKTSEVKLKAVLVYKPEPGFTEEARRNNVSGVVRLRAILGAEGRVSGISVVKGLPDGLTERSINAARHMLFFPAEVDGRAVSQYVTLEYNFNIY